MNKIKSKVKAVIFDMDGTIINTEHIWKEATIKVLQRRGFTSFSDKQNKMLLSLQGIGLIQSAKVMKENFSLTDSIDTLAIETKNYAEVLFRNGVNFVEGFEVFHKKLRLSAIPSSVATNADQASLQQLSTVMNFNRFFGTKIYSIDIVGGKAKPDPTIFLHAAKQLNVAPTECVVFEDSIFGFQAAQAAGMKCIAIKNNGNKNLLHYVDDAIDTYHEAEKALAKIGTIS